MFVQTLLKQNTKSDEFVLVEQAFIYAFPVATNLPTPVAIRFYRTVVCCNELVSGAKQKLMMPYQFIANSNQVLGCQLFLHLLYLSGSLPCFDRL